MVTLLILKDNHIIFLLQTGMMLLRINFSLRLVSVSVTDVDSPLALNNSPKQRLNKKKV